ncbi:MAG: NAD(P)/FAD-dependent oxidoreductase [Myxococcales bacterium]
MSWCSRRPRRSAVPGGTIPILAAPATCRRHCTRTRSRRSRTGVASSRINREILRYVQATAERFDVRRLVRFGEPVESAAWHERRARWIVETPRARYEARLVISCGGYLHEPQVPELPGLESFPGTVFHSSRWRHDHSLQGERVAVIGTGASAIQFVPRIQPLVRSLTLFQRTPQWILPKPDAALGELPQRLLALPGATDTLRRLLYHGFEALGAGFRHPELMRSAELLAKAHLERAVGDRALRRKLTPDYVLGCKRVLLSNDYYPALSQPNVELLATGVREIRGRSLVGTDGQAREVDTIIFGTGFHVSDPPIATRVFGRDGRSLAEVWAGSPEAHRGTTVHGFPNSFMVLGPNLAIGHNSAFVVIEAQLDYVTSALRSMREHRLSRVEVKREAQTAYNREVQRDLAGSVWNVGGCSSYYLDANGKNSIGFPWSTHTMRRLLSRFDVENYLTEAAEGPWLGGPTPVGANSGTEGLAY